MLRLVCGVYPGMLQIPAFAAISSWDKDKSGRREEKGHQVEDSKFLPVLSRRVDSDGRVHGGEHRRVSSLALRLPLPGRIWPAGHSGEGRPGLRPAAGTCARPLPSCPGPFLSASQPLSFRSLLRTQE